MHLNIRIFKDNCVLNTFEVKNILAFFTNRKWTIHVNCSRSA